MPTSNAFKKVAQARSSLILDDNAAFWAQRAMALELVEGGCPTFATDGKQLLFNPEFSEKLTEDQRVGVVVHEVWHVVDEHPWRRGDRDPGDWNIACDYSINPAIIDAGFKLPDGALIDRRFTGKSPEWIYSQIHQENKDEQQDGDKESEGGFGEVRDYPGYEGEQEIAREQNKQAVLAAAQIAQAQGAQIPDAIKRIVEAIRNPKIPWKDALRKYFQACAKDDYTMRLPNKRYMPSGLYLPSLKSEKMGPVVIFLDTSGSRDYAEARAECMSETVAIVEEAKPEVTHICSFDTRVYPLGEFYPGDPIDIKEFKGGGGTSFKMLDPWIEKQSIEPACVITITDGYGDFGPPSPWPTIWCITTDVKPPWGELVRL